MAKAVAKAEPTKEIFIDYLTKDIPLDDAILDLVDNSVDGARRIRPDRKGKKSRFDGLEVRIDFDVDQFSIVDNCGGIPFDSAKKYAFRFGRPKGMGATPDSIGQFGVGMKRALFKLGEHFHVRSVATPDTSFELTVAVAEWRESDTWAFEMETFEPKRGESPGTSIRVESLYPAVAQALGMSTFRSSLAREVEKRHQQALADGMQMRLNGIPVGMTELDLLEGNGLLPGHEEHVLFEDEPDPVTIRLYVGVGPTGKPREGGWYIYCNGRLVVGPDQTALTVWGADDEKRIPRYHNQFSQFRGYAFFESTNAGRLPWTTTKANIDVDSEVYRWARQHMIHMSRPVIDFLNNLDREKHSDNPPKYSTLEASLASAHRVRLTSVTRRGAFLAPKAKLGATRVNEQNILYRRPTAQIAKVKRALGVGTNREVGEQTFDYFFTRECDD